MATKKATSKKGKKPFATKMKTGTRLHQNRKDVKMAKEVFLKNQSVDEVLKASITLGLKKRDILDAAKSWIPDIDD